MIHFNARGLIHAYVYFKIIQYDTDMSQTMKKAIVYIDGLNLYYGIESLNNRSLKWLNLQALSESFLGTHMGKIQN